MPTEERFSKIEDRMIEVQKLQASMDTKIDLHTQKMESFFEQQVELNSKQHDRITSLEGSKAKIVAFAMGVAAVSGAGIQTVLGIFKGG